MNKKESRKGRALEQLVNSLERVLSGKEGVKIESPKFLIDRLTGKPREHDVVITTSAGHHNYILAIECRQRSRKISVNDVESFVAKCQDTRVNKGVMVSPKGFTEAAQLKAHASSISCLSIREVASFGWLLTPGVNFRQRLAANMSWNFGTKEKLEKEFACYTLLDVNGIELTKESLLVAVRKALSKLKHEGTSATRFQARIKYDSPGITLRDKESNTVHVVKEAILDVEYDVIDQLVPFELVTYENTETGKTITDAAVANIDIGPVSGRLMIVAQSGEDKIIAFLPEKPEKSKDNNMNSAPK